MHSLNMHGFVHIKLYLVTIVHAKEINKHIHSFIHTFAKKFKDKLLYITKGNEITFLHYSKNDNEV